MEASKAPTRLGSKRLRFLPDHSAGLSILAMWPTMKMDRDRDYTTCCIPAWFLPWSLRPLPCHQNRSAEGPTSPCSYYLLLPPLFYSLNPNLSSRSPQQLCLGWLGRGIHQQPTPITGVGRKSCMMVMVVRTTPNLVPSTASKTSSTSTDLFPVSHLRLSSLPSVRFSTNPNT